MDIQLRTIIFRMNYLDSLRRIYTSKAALSSGLYFGQLAILEYVEHHDMCTQREVAEMIQVSPSSIATSVKRMQRAGLIRKISDESDLRYTRLTITDKGRELAGKCRNAFDKIDHTTFAGFTAEECETLCGYLDRLIDNLAVGDFKDKSMFALLAAERQLESGQNGKEEGHA